MTAPPGNSESPLSRSQDLRAEYEICRVQANDLAAEMTIQLTQAIREAGLPLAVPIEYRVKDWSSAAHKLEQLSLRIASIREMQDLIGLRCILLFRRDAEAVCRIIGERYRVIRRYDAGARLKEDQFGYGSIHLVIAPHDQVIEPFVAELQVRTLAQHMWAAASHTLQYKKEISVPLPVRRSIHRVSALLETVDLEFERVLAERAEYREAITPITVSDLNVDLIARILDDELPHANKLEGEEPYGDLFEELRELRVASGSELRDVIVRNRDAICLADTKIVEAIVTGSEEGRRYSEVDAGRIAQGVYFTHVGLARRALALAHGLKWRTALESVSRVRSEQ